MPPALSAPIPAAPPDAPVRVPFLDLRAITAEHAGELQAAMAGQSGFPEAIERAKIATRQYAKRQSTWFSHQVGIEVQALLVVPKSAVAELQVQQAYQVSVEFLTAPM